MKRILSADIGGTNSRFALFEGNDNGELSIVKAQWLKTQESASFAHLIGNLKAGGFPLKPDEIDITVIAAAGPVERGVYCSPPFIPWDIDISNAEKDFGLGPTLLINDFVAQAFACRSPAVDSAEKILPGQIVPDEPLVVLGAGTALGKACLVPDRKGGFKTVSSEGGHTNFPFVSKRECELQDFMLKEIREDYITSNYIVSGKGLSYIHRFLTGETLEPGEVVRKFKANPVTLVWASRFYGRICRNYALETVALGGVYIAGGVAAKAPALLTHKAFESEFRSSRTMSGILRGIPVFLLSNEESGLWGAALYGLQHLTQN